jgi:murein DD-endopeptidase MepM/ murein hydrolase activator NlpD
MVTRRRSRRKKRSTDGVRGPRGPAGPLGPVDGAPARRPGGWVALVLGALVLVNLYVFVWDKQTSVGAIRREADRATPAAAVPARPLDDPALRVGSAAAPLAPGAPAVPGMPATPRAIDGRIGKSDTLGRVLKNSGLAAAEADEVIRAVSRVFDLKTLRSGQRYRIERGADGRVMSFELEVSKLQTVRAERAADGALVGKADTSHTRTELRSVGGRIESSLYATMKATGESAALIDLFADVFAYDIDFYNDTHAGDTFRILVEQELRDDQAQPGPSELIRYRRIVAAEYAGKAGTFRTFWHRDGYFDERGRSAERTLLKTPLKFQRISSGFDRRRMHPVLHTVRAHLGVDYAAPTGTPVWAAAGGVITHRSHAGGAGNMVAIRHSSGIETAYMHLSKFASGLKVGKHVAAKTVIGYVGATGLATGPHLHFGVKQKGAFIDPAKLVPVRTRTVPARQMAAFKAEVGALAAQLAAVPLPKPAT